MRSFLRLNVVCVLFFYFIGPSYVGANFTDSMPRGLYLRTLDTPTQAGSIVAVCLPQTLACFGLNRGYLHVGADCPCSTQPVLKEVLALTGDEVTVSDAALLVNGSVVPNSARNFVDSKGRLIPRTPQLCYRLLPGTLWLHGNSDPRSWDSRYYGPIRHDSVVDRLKPFPALANALLAVLLLFAVFGVISAPTS